MLTRCFHSAVDLARAVRTRDVGARDLLEQYLARIDRYNPAINAVVVQDREGARRRADEADAALARGMTWGPLHGVPVTIKESFNWAGVLTTWGIPQLKDNRATQDAVAVERLQRAGAIIVGKTNVPLGLGDFQTYNEIYGTTNNPWDTKRTPGGSSGGSAAALAAGLTGLELGSDIAGSIRAPAHYCGVFGHKPTFGLLPPRGHSPGPLRSADLGVIGPLARSARDLELVVRLLALPDELDAAGGPATLAPLDKPCASLRIAVWSHDPARPVDRDVRAAVERVATSLRDAGAELDAEARPEIDPRKSDALFRDLLDAALSVATRDEPFAKLEARVAALDSEDRSPGARSARATTMRHRTYLRLDEARLHQRWAWHRFFQRYDFLLTPVMPTAAFKHDHRPFSERMWTLDDREQHFGDAPLFWTGLPTVAYLPATVIPTGADRNGLPIAVQIIGPAYSDLKTIQLAAQLEARGFAFAPPPGFDAG